MSDIVEVEQLVQFPEKLQALFRPAPYKILEGGRGSAKSWGAARAALMLGAERPIRALCARELQTSIQESMHKLLSDQIEELGLSQFYDIQKNVIYGPDGTEFIFSGIRNNIRKIKSTEGVNLCLVEEAENISNESWRILIPTIFRRSDSEMWVIFNPYLETDPTYQRFVVNPPPSAVRITMNWRDNPWFPEGLERERQDALNLIRNARDDNERAQLQADYDHVWEGHTKRNSSAGVIKRWIIDDFVLPPLKDVRFFHGVDWGFANDPTAAVRCYIKDEVLFIDQEAFGRGVEIDELHQLFDTIPTTRQWPLKADSSRPETISYMRRQGFNIAAADKWPGSVEDGIAHLNGFKKIVIHPRCQHMAREARLYTYKVDRLTNDVLPVILDANNHGWDAVRYALDGYIQRRGGLGTWAKLAK